MFSLDWQRPWFTPLADLGQRAAQRVAQGASVAQALNEVLERGRAPDPGVRFISQHALPPGVPYEQFIFEQQRVPTRDNLHDFFNGLVWLHWPQAKRRLNAWQAGAIARDGTGATRGPLRDAITVLDEHGAVLCAPPALAGALAARQWQRAFVELRPLWQQAQLLLFGHALLEKLVFPRKSITAHVLQSPVAVENVANADVWLAAHLSAEVLAAKPFNPVPVLGVPGWDDGNGAPGFYDDPLVFRPPRMA
ncbi:DUF3025 domain-containing protein [Melaminivora suipulveris]|uniref:DUF3025 domain-containing protein n=1 Tax=Melaminivora suipulveris TaxID=2109913 RepID=UPI001F23C233|nr:DUF3025 domain-containing protein [Melaminivora suipulveris]